MDHSLSTLCAKYPRLRHDNGRPAFWMYCDRIKCDSAIRTQKELTDMVIEIIARQDKDDARSLTFAAAN